MMKNDITYEYRVFTNRLVDVGSMEVGRCTSKVIEKLKSKDKVDGRFFHTSDTDEWFFCWNGELQKLNLKGGADVNSALEEVRELIKDANAAVEEAKSAAADASAAVESIGNKADKSEVEAVAKAVDAKADASVVKELSDKVDAIKLDGYATEDFVNNKVSEIKVPTKVSELENDKNYLTEHQDISGKQDKIEDLEDIRNNADAGAVAYQNAKEYADGKFQVKGEYEAAGAATKALADAKSYTNDEIAKLNIPDNYYTKGDIDGKINAINDLIGEATTITNTILA